MTMPSITAINPNEAISIIERIPRCPFCNRTWNDPATCGELDPEFRGGWQAQNARGMLFPGRRGTLGRRAPRAMTTCVACGGQFERSVEATGEPHCSPRCRQRSHRARQIAKGLVRRTVNGKRVWVQP